MKQILILHSLLFVHCVAIKNDTALIIKESYDPTKPPRISQKTLFKSVIFDSDVLVDKTLLIKEILEDDGKTFLINCPHRWGKSTNLDMIRLFLQKQNQDDHPTNTSITSTPLYRLFVNGELVDHNNTTKLKTPMLISQHRHIIDKYLGQWPVIYLNFKFVSRNYMDMKSDLTYAIQQAYDKNILALSTFNDIVLDNYTDPETKAAAQQYIDKFRAISFFDGNRSDEDVRMSINFLSEVMYIHHKKKVFILIDDYFSPWPALYTMYRFGYKRKALFLDFFADIFLNAFKSNDYLEKGIITGLAPLFEELHAYAFDQIIECNMLTGKFMQYYGLTKYDVIRLADLVNLPRTRRRALWYWYNGHRSIAGTTSFPIYEVCSVMGYLNTKNFTNYWCDMRNEMTFYVTNFLQIQSFRKRFQTLTNGSEIVVRWDQERFTWADYEYILEAMYSIIKIDLTFVDRSFMMLHALGYLALSENYTVSSSPNEYRMRFPNTVVLYQMKKMWSIYYKNPNSKIRLNYLPPDK